MNKVAASWKESLATLSFPDIIIESWEKGGMSSLLPIQQKAINEIGFFDRSSLVIGPTSCGKTFVGEMVLVQKALQGRRCLYLVPFKAIAEEKYQEFRAKYASDSVGARIIISTADRRLQDRALTDGDFHIAILTYEKLAALVVTHPRLLVDVGAVVVDEMQMLKDEGRGAELELLLTRARQIVPSLQIIGLSAVVSDLNGFDVWLGATVLNDGHRPVPLREGIITPSGEFKCREWDGENTADSKEALPRLTGVTEDDLAVSLATHLLRDENEQVLVFATTVAGTQKLAKAIAKAVGFLPPAKLSLELLAGLESTSSIAGLNETMASAVAFHNADLTLEERMAVEAGYRNREIRCIVATSTLSMGVNLPASSVIIVKCKKWNRTPALGWHEIDLSVAEYRNMSGRAGRYGLTKDKFGRSLTICKSPFEAAAMFKTYVGATTEPLSSTLLKKPMEDIVLKTIATRLCHTEDGCVRFLLKTYAAQLEIRSDADRNALAKQIDAAIALLLKAELLARDGKAHLHATELGLICAYSGFSVGSFSTILNGVKNCSPSSIDIAYLASTLSESGPAASGVRMSGDEHRARGAYFVKLVRDAIAVEDGKLTAGMMATLPTEVLPSYETVLGIKCQAVALAYVSGVASQEIEERMDVTAGKARGVGTACSWVCDTASKIAWILKRPDEARAYEKLSDRFLHGCTEKALVIASVPHNLHRWEREALINTGYDTLQKIIDTSSIDIAKTAKINRVRVEQLQKGIVNVLGEALALERQQLTRLAATGESTARLESLYALKGTALESAIEDILTPPFCPLKVVRIAGQREGEADLKLILSDGSIGIAQVTAKEVQTDRVGIVKAMSILGQSPELRPKVFICFGRPDFLDDAIKKAQSHATGGTNYKLIPIAVLAEMYVRFKEGKLDSQRVAEVLENEMGYIDLKRI